VDNINVLSGKINDIKVEEIVRITEGTYDLLSYMTITDEVTVSDLHVSEAFNGIPLAQLMALDSTARYVCQLLARSRDKYGGGQASYSDTQRTLPPDRVTCQPSMIAIIWVFSPMLMKSEKNQDGAYRKVL